jgi:transcriptional regulator with XRE-family HTH domain
MDMLMTTGAVRLRLYEIRKERGLTQVELANMSGLHQLTISRLESDPRQIELDTLRKLCDALGIELTDLLIYTRSD